MNVKKAALYLLGALLIAFLIQSPNEAAKLVKTTGENAGEWFSAAAEAFTTFLRSII